MSNSPLKISYTISSTPNSKIGWTYVLLSQDKKTMKIGRTFQQLSKYLRDVENKNYAFGLEFLMAIEGCNHETSLLWHFSEFRTCCRFREAGKPEIFLTHSEAWKAAIRIAKEKYGRYREHEARDVYRNSVIVTRLELFEIPPRKIGAKLKEIVIEALS